MELTDQQKAQMESHKQKAEAFDTGFRLLMQSLDIKCGIAAVDIESEDGGLRGGITTIVECDDSEAAYLCRLTNRAVDRHMFG